MKRANCIALVLGLGLALSPLAMFAQAPEGQPASESAQTTATLAAIPSDQQPTKEQLARLFEVMRLRQQLESVMKAVPAVVQQQIKTQMQEVTSKLPGGKAPTPEEDAAFDKMMNKYMEKAVNIYPVGEMLDDMAVIYQHHLSRSDVDAFIAFYESPAGQHLLDAQPAIMKEYMPMVMARTQERTKALTDEMSKDIDELLKSSAPAGDQPVQH
jgi:hypothetical protein